MFRKLLYLIIASVFFIPFSEAQVNQEGKINNFSSRMKNPIDVDVQENSSGASITIYNQSYYRYLVQVKFTSVMNLRTGYGQVRNYALANGIHRLGAIPAIDKSRPVDLTFTYTCQICPSNYEKGDFTYIYPVGNLRNMKNYMFMESQTVYRNMFKMGKGDTVFAMRKGVIVNTQENVGMDDRLGPEGSFEILHEDGTVMVYTGISKHLEEIKRGKIIYPGQPIGLMDQDENILSVFLCFIQPNAAVSQMNINYTTDLFKELVKSSGKSDCIVSYPQDLIMSEMTKSEKKKFLSGKLL